jgi:DNA-binding CsgD family transcriptional regulator
MERVRRRLPGSDPRESIKDWKSIISKRWTLLEHFDSDSKRFTLAVNNRPLPPSIDLLSEREREVVLQAAGDRTNKEIAHDLGLSASTVRVLLMRAAAKVGARSRGELLEKLRVVGPEGSGSTKGP